ncbi:MAG: translation initiation factor IF-2 [Bacteroidales bacterium]|nr:translation initiation factor IF-2 [Bacteroidales bacterium]
MAGTKATRLTKAAREFNVSAGRIVEFLAKKGVEIEDNPNAKITGQIYDLLTEEFSKEKSVKEEARKIDIGNVKRETISLEDRKRPAPDFDDYDDDEDIIIRGVSVEIDDDFKKAVEPHHEMHTRKKEAPATPEKPVETPKPAEAAKPEPAKETPPSEGWPGPPAEEMPPVKSEPAPQAPTQEPVAEKAKPAPMPGEMPEPESKPAPIKAEKPAPQTVPEASAPQKAETPKEKPAAEKIAAEKPVAEKPVAETPPAEKPLADAPPAEKPPAEKPPKAAEKETERPSLNIVGTIDLSKLNERTKPTRKSSAEKRKQHDDRKKATSAKGAEGKPKTEKAGKPVEKKSKTEKATPPPVEQKKPAAEKKPEVKKSDPYEDNFLKTEFTKLTGVNVVGKIELPVEKRYERKKPVASSSDDKVKPKKKKRKRIKKEGQTTPATGETKTQTRPDDRTRAKPARPGKGRKARTEPGRELTEEEVQKQIKETLARLSGAGKSKASKYRKQKRETIHKQLEKEAQDREDDKKIITVAEFVTANELASLMNVQVTDVISVCMQLGLFVSINQRLDAETIGVVAGEFGFGVKFESAENAISDIDEEIDEEGDLEFRSPIVTVMGHVDHGKTKLLDHIRRANVIAGEAGGITQHIGAYEVVLENGKKITFLDTPGHEAFTAMRARGAKVTDVAIIVVAADDSVMPQTVEAINHAQAAGVPIVFAINKIDKPTANTERIREQLSQMNILVEDWGGKFQSQEISAKAGINIDELLEKVLLEAELLDLKANPKRRANGTIIESSLDKGRGYVAKLLVQNGTLKAGDIVIAGSHYGRVKAMYNERNLPVKSAGPSAPVLMLGMNGAPQAGDSFKVMKDERDAKNIATKRQQLQREQGLRTQKHVTLDEIGRRIAIGDFKELNIIVKGDVDGSVEALADSMLKLSTPEVQVNVIHKSVGQVTETDVMLASASNAIIVAFQVRPSIGARRLAEREQIDIRNYSIIYSAIEEIKAAIEGMLAPTIEEKILCNIEVREVFKITKVGTIAGCLVLDGTINRNNTVRVIRDGIVIYTGRLGSLKRFKDDVREVQSGYECGLNIENFNDIKVGDIIEGFEEVEIARKLES